MHCLRCRNPDAPVAPRRSARRSPSYAYPRLAASSWRMPVAWPNSEEVTDVEEKFTVKCPVCNGTLRANSEQDAIRVAQDHARDQHDMALTDQQARDLISREQSRDR
jgi:predicted small metal-binding protein